MTPRILPGDPKQDERVVREWREAVEDGNYELANRIAAANPDLVTRDLIGSVAVKRGA